MGKLFDLEEKGIFIQDTNTNDAAAANLCIRRRAYAMLTSSGQAANFFAIFNICEAGDHFLRHHYVGGLQSFNVTMRKKR